MQPGDAVRVRKNDSRERRADDSGIGDGAAESGRVADAIFLWKPERQIEQHTGYKTRFGKAQQETQAVEARRAGHESATRRDDTPRSHDPEHRPARAETFNRETPRHLKQQITNKQRTGADSVYGRREPKIMIHCECREADIHTIEKIDQIEQG